MKRVNLGKVKFRKVDTFVADLLVQLCEVTRTTGNQGFTLGEVRQRIKVIDRLEAAREKPHVDLEDAEYEILKIVIEKSSYDSADRGVIEVADKVLNATVAKQKD